MEPTGTPVDRLYRDDLLAARRRTPEEKLLAAPQLFDFACRIPPHRQSVPGWRRMME